MNALAKECTETRIFFRHIVFIPVLLTDNYTVLILCHNFPPPFFFPRVLQLEVKKEKVKEKKHQVVEKKKQNGEEEDEEEMDGDEFDEFLSWRAKKSFK